MSVAKTPLDLLLNWRAGRGNDVDGIAVAGPEITWQ